VTSIRYTKHALLRLSERGITDADVREVIASPDESRTSLHKRIIADKRIAGRHLWVVYAEREDSLLVITVYWIGERA